MESWCLVYTVCKMYIDMFWYFVLSLKRSPLKINCFLNEHAICCTHCFVLTLQVVIKTIAHVLTLRVSLFSGNDLRLVCEGKSTAHSKIIIWNCKLLKQGKICDDRVWQKYTNLALSRSLRFSRNWKRIERCSYLLLGTFCLTVNMITYLQEFWALPESI